LSYWAWRLWGSSSSGSPDSVAPSSVFPALPPDPQTPETMTPVGVDVTGPLPRRFTGKAGALPLFEQAAIFGAADQYALDARFLAAIRLQENGGPGREFGVLSVSAPTYADQLDWAARTVVHRLTTYEQGTGQSPLDPDGRYSSPFINYFAGIYAPVGAKNDPRNLNQWWPGNVIAFYDASDVEVA